MKIESDITYDACIGKKIYETGSLCHQNYHHKNIFYYYYFGVYVTYTLIQNTEFNFLFNNLKFFMYRKIKYNLSLK